MRVRKKTLTGILLISVLVAVSVVGLGCGKEERDGASVTSTGLSELRHVRDIQVTTGEEGNGARPEVLFLGGEFFVIYLTTDPPRTFKAKVYDGDFEFTGMEKTLVVTDEEGSPTDIRITTDGKDIYAAYEKPSSEDRRLYIEKYDSGLNLLKRAMVTRCDPEQAHEWIDDPAVCYEDGYLYIVTKRSYPETGYQYRIRKFDTDLDEVGEPVQIALDLPRMFGSAGVASVLPLDDNYCFVTTSAVEGTTPIAPNPDETTNVDLVAFKLDPGWAPTDWKKIVADSSDIEFKPTGFRFADNRFYLTYIRTNVSVHYPEMGKPGPQVVGAVYLKVFDLGFNELREIKVIEEDRLANHPTVEVAGDSVFVAYSTQSEGDVFVSEYRWYSRE